MAKANDNKKYTARLKPETGSHRGIDGKTYKPGELVSSDIDLINAYPGKFEDPDATGPGSENVTDEFEAALEAGLVVIKRAGKWYVCNDAASGSEISGALKKKAVEDWILDHVESLPEEEEEEEEDFDAED